MRPSGIALTICALSLMPAGAYGAASGFSFIAGAPNIESGIKFVPMAPIDGNAKLVSMKGRECLKTDGKSQNPYIYFDVNRKTLLQYGYPPYTIEMEIDYLDTGTDAIALQYDSMGSATAAHHKEIAWKKTGADLWKVKKLLIRDAQFGNGQQGVSDFRLCSGPDGDEYIAAIRIKCLSAGKTNSRAMLPERKITAKTWTVVPMRKIVIVRPAYLSEPETIALEKLCARIQYLGGGKPEIINERRQSASFKSGHDYLFIGLLQEIDLRRFPDITSPIKRLYLVNDSKARGQSYIICAQKERDTSLVLAAGQETMGAVYAMAHLETHLWTDGARLALHLDRPSSLETPGFKQRELYINIGYGLTRNRITPDTWTAQDWKDYIDKLVLARYSSWSFYLWGDSELAYPGSSVNKEKNVLVHKTIQEAIKYSHRRGLQVGYHFSPTMIPEDLLAKHPELKATLEYPANGIVCPSRPASWDIMAPVYSNEIEWFKECDFFSIWFYDCGGCFCNLCIDPDQQLKTLVQQVEVFDKIIHRNNPEAVTHVVTWGIWRYERMHKYHIRDRFMDEIGRIFANRKNQVVISDGIYIDPGCEPLFPLAKKHGFESKSFLYQTNIEDGQPFAMPMTRYFEEWVPKSLKAGVDQIHLMRMECLTKYPQDFVGGYLFWNPQAKGSEALRLYSSFAAGDASAGRMIYQAMLDMDDFSWFGIQGGGAGGKRGERIYSLIKSVVAPLPAKRRNDLEWLVTTGAGYRVLGKAIEAKNVEDQPAIDATIDQFKQALIQSPEFKSQVDSEVWLNLYKIWYIKYFEQGWAANHF